MPEKNDEGFWEISKNAFVLSVGELIVCEYLRYRLAVTSREAIEPAVVVKGLEGSRVTLILKSSMLGGDSSMMIANTT
jgi:hypothetical protein